MDNLESMVNMWLIYDWYMVNLESMVNIWLIYG